MSDRTMSFTEYVDTVMAEHAAEVGAVAVAWNRAHSTLGTLFVTLLTPNNKTNGYAVWNAMRSDRTQRDTLEALLKVSPMLEIYRDKYLWALDQISNLSTDRNDTIHAPYFIVLDKGEIKVVADAYNGNQQAKRLQDKKLTDHFKAVTKELRELREYIANVMVHQNSRPNYGVVPALPEKPKTRLSLLASERESLKARKIEAKQKNRQRVPPK